MVHLMPGDTVIVLESNNEFVLSAEAVEAIQRETPGILEEATKPTRKTRPQAKGKTRA